MRADPRDERISQAHADLDLATSVIAHGATAAPDLVMRLLIATRERLDRHQPDKHLRRCAYCGQYWLCPDVRGDLRALGVDLEAVLE